jgi:hypothetical protein
MGQCRRREHELREQRTSMLWAVIHPPCGLLCSMFWPFSGRRLMPYGVAPRCGKLAKHPHLGEIEGVQVRCFLMWDLGLSTRRGHPLYESSTVWVTGVHVWAKAA